MLAIALSVLSFLVIREVRVDLSAFDAAPARQVASAVVPAEAVSIRRLMLRSHELRVGDPAGAATSWLASSAVLKAADEDRGVLGRRQIRAYQLDDARVTVVLEPFEPQGALRVAAIYLR
jgi:hypothetical protein